MSITFVDNMVGGHWLGFARALDAVMVRPFGDCIKLAMVGSSTDTRRLNYFIFMFVFCSHWIGENVIYIDRSAFGKL